MHFVLTYHKFVCYYYTRIITMERNLFENAEQVCRLCLNAQRKLVHIFEQGDTESLKIQLTIEELCSLKLIKDDPFPKYICKTCKKKLFSVKKFINMCKESDNQLHKYYKVQMKKNCLNGAFINTREASSQTDYNNIDKDLFIQKKRRESSPTDPKIFDLEPNLSEATHLISDETKSLSSSCIEHFPSENLSKSESKSVIAVSKSNFNQTVSSQYTISQKDSLEHVSKNVKSNLKMTIHTVSPTIPIQANIPLKKCENVSNNVRYIKKKTEKTCDQSMLNQKSETQEITNNIIKDLGCDSNEIKTSVPQCLSEKKITGKGNVTCDLNKIQNPTEVISFQRNISQGVLENTCSDLTYGSNKGQHSLSEEPLNISSNSSISAKIAIPQGRKRIGKQSLVSKDNKFLCDICSRTLQTESGLRLHLKMHSGSKPFKCKVCDKGFAIESYKKRHELTHSGDKLFMCHLCSASFASANGFKYHLMAHAGEFKHSCKICGKSFVRYKYLKEHIFTHTGEKPYACKLCGVAYSNSGSLFVHEKKCKGENKKRSGMKNKDSDIVMNVYTNLDDIKGRVIILRNDSGIIQ